MAIIDTFPGSALNPSLWIITKTGAAPPPADPIINNRLEIACPASDGQGRLVGIQTKAPIWFKDKSFEIDIVQNVNPASNIRSNPFYLVDLTGGTSNSCWIFIENNTMLMFRYSAGVLNNVSVAWNAAYEAIRVTHNSTDNHWRVFTRTTGVWTQRLITTVAAGWQPIFSSIRVSAENAGSFAAGGTFIADNVNSDAFFYTYQSGHEGRVHRQNALPFQFRGSFYQQQPLSSGRPVIIRGQSFPSSFDF